QLAPTGRLHSLRGWLHAIRGTLPFALNDFEEAIRLDKNSSDAHAGRGYARVKLGHLKEAIDDAEAALKLGGPKDFHLRYNAARIFAQAAGRMDADARQQDRRGPEQRAYFQGRAVRLLRQALELCEDQEREALCRDIRADSALSPIRRSVE